MVSSHQLNFKINCRVLLLKTYLTALKLFPVVCCYGWKGWNGLKLEQTAPIFSSFDAVFKNHQNNCYRYLSLIKSIWYLPHSFRGAFCVPIKALMDDFSTESFWTKTAKSLWRSPFEGLPVHDTEFRSFSNLVPRARVTLVQRNGNELYLRPLI